MKKIKSENGNYKKIYYYDAEETKISSKFYYNSKDKLHREDGPAEIWYYESGEIMNELYYINGKRHRLNGPAVIWYNRSGEIEYKYYYINNIEYLKEEYNKKINIDRNLKLLNKR